MEPTSQKRQIALPAVLIAVLLLILIIGGIYFARYLEQQIHEERKDQLVEITSQINTNLNNMLNTRWDYLTFAINMLERRKPETIQETTDYIGTLENILETERNSSILVLLDSQGNFYDAGGKRGVWSEAKMLASGETRYSFISDSQNYQSSFWGFAHKLPTPIQDNETGVSFTYIVLLQDMRAMIKYYNNDAYHEHNETYVLKSDGTRMNKNLFLDRIIESYDVLSELENMEGQKYSDILATLNERGTLSSKFIYNDVEYYYCITSLESYDGLLLFLIPGEFVATETVKMVNAVIRTLLILAAILLILLILTVTAILRHRSSVYMALQEQSNRLHQEELNTRLEESNTLLAESKKAVEESLQIAEEANRAKSLFLSNMSHEIRTPINAVLGMNEMILRECKDETLLSYAANIQSSGKTLLFLINDILDMSKIESGKMEIVPSKYETSDLILDLWNGIYLRAQEKGLTIDFSLDDTLPCRLFGDDVRVKQIVTNLLTNAVKYTAKGGVKLHADYQETADDMINLVISVKDTGMGIREEDMDKLFESFQRIDEKKNRNIEGTGLGMNIVMSLLKLMGGEIKVDSEYQKGSTFTVTIPQKVISDEPTGDFQTIMSKQRAIAAQKQKSFEAPDANVLVVDDNSMNLAVFQALLKRTKMNIVTAVSGKKCLELIKEQSFDIIFMDHMMPEMDGIETLHEMQKLTDFPNENTPVIALTANALSGARETYLKEGFQDFLTKPIDSNLLEQMVLSYLPDELVQIPEQTEVSPPTDADKDMDADEDDADKYNQYLQYGISIATGLRLADEDFDLYLNLVNMFVKDIQKQDTMQQFIDDKNIKDYAVFVHGLKGNARTLGANELADMAYEHEMKSKAGDLEYVDTHWDELITVWNHTLDGFLAFYEEYGNAEEDTYGMVASPDGEVLELSENDLDEVIAFLDNFETEKAVEKLKTWIDSPLEQDMHRLIKDVLVAIEDEFDEDKAIELLKNERR